MSVLRLSLLGIAWALFSGGHLLAGSGVGLQWDQTVIETAPPEEESIAEAWFTFSNATDAPIEILEVKSDCDCLVAQLDQKTYYPGESGLLLARIEPGKNSSAAEKRITVVTRSGHNEPGTVQLLVRLSPKKPGMAP